jgi:hypothetical protein
MKKPIAKRKGYAEGGKVSGGRYDLMPRSEYDETPQGLMIKPGTDAARRGSTTITGFGGQRYYDNQAGPSQGMAKAKGGAVKKVMAARKRK